MSTVDHIDPALYDRDDLRTALAHHDIRTLYRALKDAGISQHRIARATGQSQSEVSEIIAGRQVIAYAVLARIATGLTIPRHYLGLSYGADSGDGTYRGVVTVTDAPGGVDDMLRRRFQHLLALAAATAVGMPAIRGVGELATLPTPPLPAPNGRISTADVGLIRQCTAQVRALARQSGGQARTSVQLTGWAEQWLDADCSPLVRRELLGVLSDLHVIAGWCCHDAGALPRAHHHFTRALELARDGGDSYAAAYALQHAGMSLVERWQPNEGLKMLQLAELHLPGTDRGDTRIPGIRSELASSSAFALARMGGASQDQQARAQLDRARDGWNPATVHAQADMDLTTALTWLHLRKFDTAEAAAATSVRTFQQSGDRREGVLADMVLARLHVQAGEARGLALARAAIEGVASTRSNVARQCTLPGLIEALETQPGSDARDLARMARQVATTRA